MPRCPVFTLSDDKVKIAFKKITCFVLYLQQQKVDLSNGICSSDRYIAVK